MKRIISLVALIFLFVSCAPTSLKPWKPPELVFKVTPSYSVQEGLDAIKKPESPKRIYVKVEGDEVRAVPKEEATHIMFAPEQYAKIGAVVKLTKVYKDIILEQEKLVNLYITQINALKELVALEQKKSMAYQELWISSENSYRQEVYDHKFDNILNRSFVYVVTVGSILVFLLAL